MEGSILLLETQKLRIRAIEWSITVKGKEEDDEEGREYMRFAFSKGN